MKRKYWNIGMRLIAWVLLIQVVNLSIDPMDPISDKLGRLTHENEDLSINDIESIYELVSEQCLGIEVPEHDEDDENSFVKVMDFFFAGNAIQISRPLTGNRVKFFPLNQRINSIAPDLCYPPPKVA